ncbi:MAG: twin-arginine translocase TatA/TatE family subunit [Microbacteriaceae bacterium]|nr:twin-arginine translocase TatA/TatE family subunit [Microbacteriaceae bacterium]
MFGLTFEKLLLIGLVALFLIGPDRLPQAAQSFAKLIKKLKGFADTAKERMQEELGDEFEEVKWEQLDPRKYDPRRIIRDALLSDPETPASPTPLVKRDPNAAVPFDQEAT